jgi:RsiW-degrading membrane proteinase PrsW (M82 family)
MAFIALAASIIATVVPTIVYVFVLWWFDRYEKEPIGLLAIAFFWGAIPAVVLSIIGEVIAGVPLSTLDAASSEMIGSSAIAPFVEESVKGLIVFVLYWIFYKEFDSPIDGIIYGALVGHGFGMTENLFYFLGAWANGGWGIVERGGVCARVCVWTQPCILYQFDRTRFISRANESECVCPRSVCDTWLERGNAFSRDP